VGEGIQLVRRSTEGEGPMISFVFFAVIVLACAIWLRGGV
jgi:hypothetical protein